MYHKTETTEPQEVDIYIREHITRCNNQCTDKTDTRQHIRCNPPRHTLCHPNQRLAFHAIEQIIGHHYELDDFNVQAVTKGREAVGSAIIRLRAGGKLYAGNGVSTDTVDACIRAYINALNKIVYDEQ